MRRTRGHRMDSRIVDIADVLGRQENLTLGDGELLAKVAGMLGELRDNPATVHGRRVEAMFGYVAAALDGCSVVKREDGGELLAPEQELLVPDYRLLVKKRGEMLVEVKNCHQVRRFSIRSADLERLQAYADLFSIPLRLAVYWSRWRVWTLVSPDVLRPCGERRHELTFPGAMRCNRMGELGDVMLATTPPLTLRILTDPTAPRRVAGDGSVRFTIGAIQIFAGEREITAKKERNLAFYLMMYGQWLEDAPRARTDADELLWVDFVSRPLDNGDDDDGERLQPFRIVGALSSMIASSYDGRTTAGGKVIHLTPGVSPRALSCTVPGRVAGMTLPLWIFHQQPAEAGELLDDREEVS